MSRDTFRESEKVWALRAKMDAAYKALCSARRPGPREKIGKLYDAWKAHASVYAAAFENEFARSKKIMNSDNFNPENYYNQED